MKNLIKQDIISGLVLILISVGLFVNTLQINDEPAFYPRILLVLLAILGVGILFNGIKTLKINPEAKREVDNDEEVLYLSVVKTPILILLLVIIYALMINYIGFFVSTTLFIISFLLFAKVRKWWVYLNVVVILNVFIYIIFVTQLNVRLPEGILF